MIEMHDSDDLVAYIKAIAEQTRAFVAITGAPGAGKSTLVESLCAELNRELDEPQAVVVPMDGYHLDNSVLQQHDILDRKGAPFTFDATALAVDLERIHDNERVNVPVFDRARDCSRAFAREVTAKHRIVIVEGNYLCCNQAPWNIIAGGFDCHIHLEVDPTVLEQRLLQRWLEQGLSEEKARNRVDNNDMPNVHWVSEHTNEPDIAYRPTSA